MNVILPIQSISASPSSSWVSNILSMLTAWIADYGYPAVFAAALLETVFPPIPSEIVFPLAGFTAMIGSLVLKMQ
jgi:membrane protein DedA with SNARE-associated domain